MNAASGHALRDAIDDAARQVGFDFVGFTDAVPARDAERLPEWLQAGMHGTMQYLEDPEGKRGDPRRYLPWARSLILVGLHYDSGHPLTTDAEHGAISRYAWGSDYHRAIQQRLERLQHAINELAPRTRVHRFVDTSPVLEKGVAEVAGLGWQGKHTNLIRKQEGSWFFLGGVATDLELPADAAAHDHCGTCTRCIDVCPTGAIVAPYVLDARLCIAYLTIELRGPIPRDLRPSIGNRVFGCDDCQDVCPWNHHAQKTSLPEFQPIDGHLNPPLALLFSMTQRQWNRRFRHTPVFRAHYEGFIRNVAVALGNWGTSEAARILEQRVDDPSVLVRGHVAWALGRTQDGVALELLRQRSTTEEDAWVREEITHALQSHEGHT